MSSWGLAGSPDSTTWSHNDQPALARSISTGDRASQPFPVPNVTAAIVGYLASQPPPIGNGKDTSQPSPRQHSFAGAHLWLPRHQHHATTAATWPWTSPTFAPPLPPSISSWAIAPPGGEIPDVSSSCGTRTAGAAAPLDAPGCLHVARRAGCKAAGDRRNFVLSPLSLHASLALVAAGTDGETQRELLSFLGLASLDELRRAAETELVGALRGLPQTAFACGVGVDGRWALRPEFVAAAGAVYAAVAESVDFVSQAEQARQRVNAFVSDETKGLIGAVLPPGSVDASTVVVLANALYFKGTWAQPFDQSRTFHAPFHLPDGATVRAPFMTSSFEQRVAVFPGFSALKLPYYMHWNQAVWFYMLVLLPHGKALDITDLYDKAVSTPGFIKKHTPAAKVPVGRFMVPKFKFAFEFEASEDMQKLGVTEAFRSGDFSGMVAGGGDGLSIGGVYHKATVEVDEAGTVAAAATAVSICQSASASPPVDFLADRPFLFAVVEEKSGAVLFFGHVVNPLAE